MSKSLYFEPESKAYRKTSTLSLVVHGPPERLAADARPASPSVSPSTTSRAETINRAYGTPASAARLRRRRGGEPRYRRIRPDVVTGAQRLRTSRSAMSPASPRRGPSGGSSGGSSGSDY